MDDATQRTLTTPELAGAGDAEAPTLRVLYTGSAGVAASVRRVLAPGVLPLGRASEAPELASLSADPSVSRRHADLTVSSDGKISLADAGSHNGTFVNGDKIGIRALDDGDVIRLGHALLLFRREPSGLADVAIEGLEGRSPAVRVLRSFIKLVASTPSTVLLLGETGVGKSVAARALHDLGRRAGPFVNVNCSAIPESLAESQLFGHVAGAFTGARKDHVGYFRSAKGGTLFLDEIGDLPAPVQAKLLGVLEERTVTPVGSVVPVACDVRVVAATNVDLEQAVARGTFRADLFARTSELRLTIPPLRERREDVLALLATTLGEGVSPLAPKLAEALVLYDWPYNVRELGKVATELKIRGQGHPRLELELLGDRLTHVRPIAEPSAAREVASARGPIPTREELVRLLQDAKGMVSQVAHATGRSRKQVYRWLEQYGLDVERFRQ